MVKFTKDGSTANTAAVKLARAFTGRPLVALCVDQPFFSYDDWAMVVTPLTAGIPPGVEELTVTFRYNDIGSVERLFEAHPDSIACVILEAEKGEPPRDGFLHRVRELCTTSGTLFVLDEMITGFRWDLPGAQTLYGLEPDLSTFGKAMANGFALSALAGRREIMERGGLESEEERVFLLSTTHGAETASLAAALATMEVYREQDVIGHLWTVGRRLMDGLNAAARDAGVPFRCTGYPPMSAMHLDVPAAAVAPAWHTLLAGCARRGVLLRRGGLNFVTLAHTPADVDRAVDVCAAAFGDLRAAGYEGAPASTPVPLGERGRGQQIGI
jgi:glutamate-1-semialdehyde 2,1-aminomutase